MTKTFEHPTSPVWRSHFEIAKVMDELVFPVAIDSTLHRANVSRTSLSRSATNTQALPIAWKNGK